MRVLQETGRRTVLVLLLILTPWLVRSLGGPSAWQPERPRKPLPMRWQAQPDEAPARVSPQSVPSTIDESGMRRARDRLAAISLELLELESERDELESELLVLQSKRAEVELQTGSEQAEYEQLRSEQEEATVRFLEDQQVARILLEVRRIELESAISALDEQLSERTRQARLAADRVDYLRGLNFVSDQLASAVEALGRLEMERDQIQGERDRLRLQLRSEVSEAESFSDWQVRQEQAAQLREIETRVDQLRRRYGELREEGETMRARESEIRDRIGRLDADIMSKEQQQALAQEAYENALAAVRDRSVQQPQRPS